MVGQSEMQADQAGAVQICKGRHLALEIAENRHYARRINASVGDESPDRTIDARRNAVVVGADKCAFTRSLHYLHFIQRVTLSPQSCHTICSIHK